MSVSRYEPVSVARHPEHDASDLFRAETIDARLEALEAQIARLQEEARQLRARRNNTLCNPALALPIELLMRIFVEYARSISIASERRSCKRLLIPASICKYWRDAAMLCKEYWRYIPMDQATWIHNTLPRAGEFTLVTWLTDCLATRRHGELFAQIMPRVASLTVEPDLNTIDPRIPWSFEEFLDTHIAGCTPSMHSLTVILENRNYAAAPRFGEPPREGMPELRYLHLSGFDWSWDNTIFVPSITHLRLRGYINPRDPAFFGTLKKLPSLEVLELEAISDPGSYSEKTVYEQIPRYPATIQLPGLRSFRLSGVPGPCALLLYGISFPPEAEVSLVCDYRCPSLPFNEYGDMPQFVPELPTVDLLFRNVFSWIAFHYKTADSSIEIPPLMIEMQASEVKEDCRSGSFNFNVHSTNDTTHSDGVYTPTRHIHLNLEGSWSLSESTQEEFGLLPVTQVLRDALCIFDSTKVQQLITELQLRKPHFDTFLQEALSKLSDLKTLSLVWSGIGPSLLGYLSLPRTTLPQLSQEQYTDEPSKERPQATPTLEMYFPQLDRLELHFINFDHALPNSPDDHNEDTPYTGTWGQMAANLLHRGLRNRMNAGVPIRSLNLQQCRRVPHWLYTELSRMYSSSQDKWDILDDRNDILDGVYPSSDDALPGCDVWA